MVDVTADHYGSITIDEGERSFIVFNFTYYGTLNTSHDFVIFYNTSEDTDLAMVPRESTTVETFLQYAEAPLNCDSMLCNNNQNLISRFPVLLINGNDEMNQTMIQCRYSLNSSRSYKCDFSIFVTVSSNRMEGEQYWVSP